MDNRRQVELLKKYKKKRCIDEDDKEELKRLKELKERHLIIFNFNGECRTAQATKEGKNKIGLYH